MRKFIIHIIIFFIPLSCILVPSFLLFYHSGEFFNNTSFINRVNQKKDSLIGYMRSQNNYRKIKLEKVLNNNSYDVWALGSSTVLQFREEMFSSSFYNLGLMISPISDIKTFLSVVPKDKMPKLIILGLDQWMFNMDWVNYTSIKNYYFWEKSFRYFPNFQDSRFLYSKILNDEIEYFGAMKKAVNSRNKIGLNAILKNSGIRYDGSMNFGEKIEFLLNKKNIDHLLEFENTLQRIKNGNRRFQFGKTPRKKSFNELSEVLEIVKSYNIKMIAFFTPFSRIVWDKMNEVDYEYDYIAISSEKLNVLFKDYKYEFWDYSDPMLINSNNNEFIDGFHAGELTHAKIILNMIENNSIIKDHINYNRLKNEVKNTKNQLIIYNQN